MPATGLKIVGTGHVYHGVASPLLFKTVEDIWASRVMSFWSFGVGIWPHSCLRAAEEVMVVFDIFFV